MAKAEQTRGSKHSGPNARRYEKRRASRLRRRAEKLDPENAPKRTIEGWVD